MHVAVAAVRMAMGMRMVMPVGMVMIVAGMGAVMHRFVSWDAAQAFLILLQVRR